MKFNISEGTASPLELKVGNVYPTKGGCKGGAYWIVIAITETNVVLLRLSHTGEIVGATTYGKHVFDGSNKHWNRNDSLLGHCDDLEGMQFTIKWGASHERKI